MIYVAALREIHTRLTLQSRAADPGNNVTAGIIHGLNWRPNGEYRVDGEKDLPQLSMTDLETSDGKGSSGGGLTLFLRTKRRDKWVSETPADLPGLWDWVERVLDAIELSPSTGLSDCHLGLHKADGTPIMKNGNQVSLLTDQFTTSARMAEITDASFLAEIKIDFTAPTGRRGNRRSAPVTNSDYTP
jgi:hypothetical protein